MKLRLKRELGLFEAVFYGLGIIIGAGIYVLIGEASALAGNALWISFFAGALISTFTGLSYAELSAMYPKAAAEFVYVKKAYGSKFFAFLIGWLILFTGVVSAATVSLGFSKNLRGFACQFFLDCNHFNSVKVFDTLTIIVISSVLIAVMSFVNFAGIKESSRFNIIFTSLEILGLLIIIFLGLPKVGSVNYFYSPLGMKGVFSAAALIFFAYIGFEDIVNIAEETKSPKKNIPYALIIAIAVTMLLYIFTSITAVSIVGWEGLSSSDAPLAYAASKTFLGHNAYVAIALISLFATSSTVLIILVVTSRMLYGMARENSFPAFLGRIHKKKRTPWMAVAAIGVISIAFVFVGDMALIANVTSLGALVTFMTLNLSLIWLRYTKPKLERPFKVPLNIGNYPILAFFGVFTCWFLIFQFEWKIMAVSIVVVAAGAVFYWMRRNKIIE